MERKIGRKNKILFFLPVIENKNLKLLIKTL